MLCDSEVMALLMSALGGMWDWFWSNAIAIAAFGATFWGAHIAREHNRLSVTPYISTFINYGTGNAPYEISVDLLNKGIGPAKIERYQVLLDGEPVPAKKSADLNKMLFELLPETLEACSTTHLTSQYMMAAHESRTIAHLIFKLGVKEDDVIETLERLSLVVDYKCMYGTLHHFDSRDEPKEPQHVTPAAS